MALACCWAAPAVAQNSTGEYRASLDAINLEMRAMWGEVDRFRVERRYCRPPPPSKAEAQAELTALEARVNELNSRYQAMRQSLLSFLDNNHRLYTELMVNNVDPRDRRWWTHYEASRKKMFDELAAKKAALAAAPEVNCGPPTPKPAVTTGQPTTQPPRQQPSSLPQRPAYDPLNWPPFPPHFCSWDEYWKFIIERINPLYEKAAENAELAARFRTQVEVAVNNLVQAGKPVPAALQALRRQAIADVAEQDRLSRESEDIRRRAKAIPVIDCRTPVRNEPPRAAPPATPKELPQWGRGLDQLDQQEIATQQRIIDEVEADFRALEEMARRRGPCGALWDEAEDIDYGFDELEDEGGFPPSLIREWRDRLDQIMDDCPVPKFPGQPGWVLPADPRMRIILEEHNKERDRIGVLRLQWDPQLAAGAMAYATELGRTGQRAHSSREGRGAVRENLNQGMLGWSAGQMVQNWVKEKQNFYPGTYPDVTRTGQWQDVSHYTQMIWPTTTQVGCGLASGSGYQWLVCRYSPGGNKDGQLVGQPSNQPVIAQDSGVAPPNSSTPIIPLDLGKMKMGGGMTQIDPPPPPPPTARDDAPNGDETQHPLVNYFNQALTEHRDAVKKCDEAAKARALAKMKYALDELKKRYKAAKGAAKAGVGAVKPEDVQREIRRIEREIHDAENPRSPEQCPERG